MKRMMLAIATAAAVLTTAPLLAGTARADSTRLAQADVDVRIGPRGPGVVIDEPRRRRDVEIETEGRTLRDCRSVNVREWRNGVRVTRTERRCDRTAPTRRPNENGLRSEAIFFVHVSATVTSRRP